MRDPTVLSIFHHARFSLALQTFLDQPGDGRVHQEIPAAGLSWVLLIGAILWLNLSNRLERLARSADRRELSLYIRA